MYRYIDRYRRFYLKFSAYYTCVIERAQPYSAATNRCNLCIAEKYFIVKTKPSLNKRRQIFSSCPHRKKHLLQNYQWPGNEKKTTTQGRNGNRTHLSHTRRERRTGDTFVLRLKHKCSMQRI